MIRVLDGTNQVAEYTYNGAGQRIKKVTQTETRIFHYDLRGHLIAETNQSGQMLAEYVYLGDQLLSMIKPGEAVYYFHNDHLGTPQVLTDDTQTIAWKAVYTPFGEAVASIQTVENPFRFPGQYYDSETGLHYNYFRYYNPQTGRYVTPDPIGLWGGINLYVYVRGNPLRWVDRKGLFGPGGLGSAYSGHGDFSGSVMIGGIFDYNLEDVDPNTNPYTHPEGHFRDLGQSEADVAAAIASCNKDAFQRAMHRGQDFFTHYNKGYRWAPGQVWVPCAGLGHVCVGTTADEDVDAWWDAEMWTQARLKEWEEKCGCKK